MCAAFSFRNSIVFAFFRPFNRRFCCVYHNHLIFHVAFQRCLPPRQREGPVSNQCIFHPFYPSIDIAFRYSVTGPLYGHRYGIPADIPGRQAADLLCSALASSLDAGAFPHILSVISLPSSQMLLALPPLSSGILHLSILLSFRTSFPYFIAFPYFRKRSSIPMFRFLPVFAEWQNSAG